MASLKPTILRFDSIDSTNLEATRQAKSGAQEGLCIIAREQTAGRGRLDRSWQSPRDAGLYFSIVLRPQLRMNAWPLITLMAALAVSDALMKACGLRADIKWPNDLCVNERKLCGILAETIDTKAGLAAVVGIGINLKADGLPATVSDLATSVEAATGRMPEGEERHQRTGKGHRRAIRAAAKPAGRRTYDSRVVRQFVLRCWQTSPSWIGE